MTDDLPKVAGGIDAYEFYVEIEMQFRCHDCGEHMECPILDTDVEYPQPPWATREGRRGMALGWYVPPLTPDGSLRWFSLCPGCAQKRDLVVHRPDDHAA
jgi:hypothetical protein